MTTGHTHRHISETEPPVSLLCASSRLILTPLRGRLCTPRDSGSPRPAHLPKPPTRDTRLRPRVRWLSVQRRFSRSGERTPHCTQGPFSAGETADPANKPRCALTSGGLCFRGRFAWEAMNLGERQAPSASSQTRLNGPIVHLAQPEPPHLCVPGGLSHIIERLGFCCYSWLLRALNI